MYKCKVCDKEGSPNYTEPVNSRLTERKLCFNCDYWMERVEWRKQEGDSGKQVVVAHDGRRIAYWIGDEDDSSGFRGYGGQKFLIRYKSGKLIETTNLWHNDVVPEQFHKLLPVNAEFVRD